MHRRKAIYRRLGRELGQVYRRLARRKESEIEEGHLRSDHMHTIILLAPKQSVAPWLTRCVAGNGRLLEMVDGVESESRMMPQQVFTDVGFRDEEILRRLQKMTDAYSGFGQVEPFGRGEARPGTGGLGAHARQANNRFGESCYARG